MAKKRTPAAELVRQSGREKVPCWLDALSARDQKYVREVAYAWRAASHIPIYAIARRLISELNLTVKPGTVVTKLQELARDKKNA